MPPVPRGPRSAPVWSEWKRSHPLSSPSASTTPHEQHGARRGVGTAQRHPPWCRGPGEAPYDERAQVTGIGCKCDAGIGNQTDP